MAIDAVTAGDTVKDGEDPVNDDGDYVDDEDESSADVSADSSVPESNTVDEDESVIDDQAKRDALSSSRVPALVGTLLVAVLAGLAVFTGVRAYQAHQVAEQRNLLLQVARQGAVNLTTISWEHAEDDIRRILDSATGQFYDDFSQRSKPFVDVVKQAQSTSVGTVTESGMESYAGDTAQVLVSVAVTTTNPVAPEQGPRNWRMRMSVAKVGDDEAKVSNVEFVP